MGDGEVDYDDTHLKALLMHQNSLLQTVSCIASNLCEIAIHDGANDAVRNQFGQEKLSLVASSHSECSDIIMFTFQDLQTQLKEKEKENIRLKKQLAALRSGHDDVNLEDIEENSHGESD